MTISRPPVVFGANWITLVRAALCGRPGLVRRAFCCLDRTFHPDNSRRKLLLCSGLLLFLASPSSIHAQEPDRQELEQSCRTYVQRFYTWYVRLSEKDTPHAQDLALKRFAFSPELVRGLREDSRAQTRYSDQGIVGLDFDPFIGGNGGPLGRYVVGRIKPMSGHYLAQVSIAPGDARHPVVAAEVAFQDGQWRFLNFHYYIYEKGPGKPTDHFDLLSALKENREWRRKNLK